MLEFGRGDPSLYNLYFNYLDLIFNYLNIFGNYLAICLTNNPLNLLVKLLVPSISDGKCL